MAEREWTKEQLSAIDARGKTLLVSAAAGSGKTATLTERIIRRLLDKKNPVTIDSLLVVTYTKTAAGELYEKISAALEKAVNDNPDNEALVRQLMMLPSAKIKTIDAFCNDILRANVDRVGLPPSYRISTGAECAILSDGILKGLIDAVYSGEALHIATPEEFEELAECLTPSRRTEDLADTIMYVYDKCQSSIEGADIMNRLVDIFSPEKYVNVESTAHGKYLMNKVDQALKHYINRINAYKREFECGGSLEAPYVSVACEDVSMLTNILSAKTYEEKRERLSLGSLKKVKEFKGKGVITDFAAYLKLVENDIEYFKSFFIYTADEWKELYDSLYRVLTVLRKFILAFDRAFVEEKRQRGIVTYADVERYTYHCLWKDGERTDIAENLKNKFSEIYIDEYQDVNALQDKIFEGISSSNNRFMVGDIKQSIYCFRSARPEIFAEMKATYPPIEESGGNTASIFMSSNFRCDKGIVDFTNMIFDRMFGLLGENIGYVDGDKLKYAKKHDVEPPYRKPAVVITIQDQYNKDKKEIPAEEVVALKIEQLVKNGRLDDGEKVKYSDIALIFRTGTQIEKYAGALARRGIETEISVPENFFITPEVLLTLSFLNTIDNPRRDIYLAALLCSPLFSFSGDELATIRRRSDAETLYEALCQYVEENPDFEKGASFLKDLRCYRSLSENTPVDKLIYKIYHETGLLSLASKNGGRKNLMFLYDHARSFQAGAFKGLYNFISYIDNVISGRITKEFEEKRAGENKNAVKIVTAHSSKGLEYPIVFFVNANKKISSSSPKLDSKDKWIRYSEEMGISLLLRTPSGLARVINPVNMVMEEYLNEKTFEEELRVLYVILTRARERLYVIGDAPQKDIDAYRNKIRILRENLSSYSAVNLTSYLDIILASTGVKGFDANEFINMKEDEDREEDKKPAADNDNKNENKNSDDPADLLDELTKRFTFAYDRPYMSELPEKMSVSKITPTVLDGADENTVSITLPEGEGEEKDTLPAFMTGTEEAESAKRGIATHYFMQFCDLEKFATEGSRAELDRLLSEQYISKQDGERVRIKELEAFRNSALLRKMLGASKLYRELRFNVRLPAKYFTEDEKRRATYLDETILVQGVIDCVFEDENGDLHLIDYKTDRLTMEERLDRSMGEERLRKAHTLQLSYYALAINEIFGKLPKTIGVYSLHLGDEVEIKNCFVD